MTPHERVLTTLAHREPDRVPFNVRLGPELVERFRQEYGNDAFAEHFQHDVRYVTWTPPERPAGLPCQAWTPTPDDAVVAKLALAASELHRRGLAVCGSYEMGVYEQAKDWLGDEAAMVAPFEQPETFRALLERIAEWKCAIYGAYARAGTDIVWIGDDLGTQRSLVMSPAQYREWYRPHHRRIVDHLRSLRGDIKIAFHCCGHVTPLIPDLIELGIDILEAVQAEAMDIGFLKREFGRDIAFWGGVGAQSVLQGTVPQVTAGVRQTLRLMAPGGGYIAAPCHTLTAEVSWDSVLAFHDALVRYGAYPHPGEKSA